MHLVGSGNDFRWLGWFSKMDRWLTLEVAQLLEVHIYNTVWDKSEVASVRETSVIV